jgi:ABC-type multidrug transport system fused ATPase/permease subunit
MGHIYLSFAMSLSGFVFAFFRGWLLTLIILAMFPILILITFIMTKKMKSGFEESQRALSRSFGHAEQAIHNMVVV